MHVEVSVALNFVISYMYNKLPRRRVDMFGEELEKGLKMKFDGHWYPDKPFKGSAFRCIRITGEGMDPVMEMAASNSGLDIEEIKEYLPADLTVWIDPLEVSYRIGEKGVVKVLYSNKGEAEVDHGLDREIQAANRGFNPDAQCFKPIDSLSSSVSNLSLSPSSPSGGSPPAAPQFTQSTSPITSFLNRSTQKPLMTTAMFAQTKFGSTKLKSQAKRPSRLSPTEVAPGHHFKQHRMQGIPGVPVSQLSPGSGHSPTNGYGPSVPAMRPHTLSPRDAHDPRQDFLGQQRLYMSAHAQQQQPLGMGSPAMLSPMDQSPVAGGNLNDLYGSYGSSILYSDLLSSQANGQNSPRGGSSIQQNTPSPDANRTLLDGFNMNTLPPYANLQHLLVAN